MTETTGDRREWPDGEGTIRREATVPADGALIVDLGGFEGPLDLLLDLARHQKIDLSRLSMLALAEQYLAFIDSARAQRLELAADYLVMAAWLAYLKSRLLLPSIPDSDEPAAADLAQRLAFRLQRLQAMREAAAQLMARNRLGRDVFERGEPEPLKVETQVEYANNLVDLLKAYAERRKQKMRHQTYTVRKIKAWSIKEARAVLERMVGVMDDWGRLDDWLAQYLASPESRASVVASSFTASLELAREGSIEIRQERAFEPIFLRRKRRVA
jgi:segregation and condensation protein A